MINDYSQKINIFDPINQRLVYNPYSWTMKKIHLLIACCLATTFSFAQNVVDTVYTTPLYKPVPATKAITVGFLQGGGSLIGGDLEILLSDRLGIQGGIGMFAYGFGLNYHLKPGISSSFLSFGYWHQGLGSTFVQSLVGPSFVFRAKEIFTAQIGLGAILQRGPAYVTSDVEVPMILTYSIGLYFPI